MNKKLFFIVSLFVWLTFVVFCVSNSSISASSVKKTTTSKNTLSVTNNITKSHLELKALNNILYILPPESSFVPDTNKKFFGLSSNKYPDVIMRFIYSGMDYDDNDSLINIKYKMLKKIPKFVVNNYVRVWAYKVAPKNESTANYTWLIFIDDDISYIQGTFTYNKKYDNVLGKNMEHVVKNIVSIPNPILKPEHSIFCEGDYSMLDMQFVPQVMAPVAYFTKDAKPFRTTGYSQMLAVASPPDILQPTDDKIDVSIEAANRILSLSKLNDSVIVEQLGETEINGHKGYWIKGSLQNNINKRLIIYYADDIDNSYFLILGLCDAKEEKDFFEKIDKFKTTLKRRM